MTCQRLQVRVQKGTGTHKGGSASHTVCPCSPAQEQHWPGGDDDDDECSHSDDDDDDECSRSDDDDDDECSHSDDDDDGDNNLLTLWLLTNSKATLADLALVNIEID